jgi:translation initiation factor 1
MPKAKQRVTVDGAQPALRQPLPGLAALRDKLPASTVPGAVAATPAPDAAQPGTAAAAPGAALYVRAARVVVRRERKGYGGKTVTRVEGLAGSARELEAAVRDVKRALGCGATLEGSDVVVQGDQGERLRAFLAARGVRKIVVGN